MYNFSTPKMKICGNTILKSHYFPLLKYLQNGDYAMYQKCNQFNHKFNPVNVLKYI